MPRIKRLRPDLPVIVMSAQNTLMTAIKAPQRGAYEYLPKPFDLQELLAVVGRALAAPQPVAEPTEPVEPRDEEAPAADRPLAGDAGDLPHARAADDRPTSP